MHVCTHKEPHDFNDADLPNDCMMLRIHKCVQHLFLDLRLLKSNSWWAHDRQVILFQVECITGQCTGLIAALESFLKLHLTVTQPLTQVEISGILKRGHTVYKCKLGYYYFPFHWFSVLSHMIVYVHMYYYVGIYCIAASPLLPLHIISHCCSFDIYRRHVRTYTCTCK